MYSRMYAAMRASHLGRVMRTLIVGSALEDAGQHESVNGTADERPAPRGAVG